MISTGVAGVVLWPIRTLARLPLAASGTAFLAALPWAALIIALNYVWILRADTSFEEASVEHSEIQARTPPGQRRSVVRRRRPPFRLAASGLPEVALLWKNLTMLRRQASLHLLVILVPGAGIVVGLLAAGAGRNGLPLIAAVLCFGLALILVVMGPLTTRIDLRHDLVNLPLLKTWPLRGATLVRGAVLAPTVVLSAMVVVLVALGTVLLGEVTVANPAGSRAALINARFVYAGVVLLLAPPLVLIQVVVQNAIAVTFPAWMTIGPSPGRGLETMGQQMVVMFGSLFAIVVALVPTAIVTTVAGFAIYQLTGTVALLPCAGIAAVVILIQCWVATELIGAILDRTDVGAIDAPMS